MTQRNPMNDRYNGENRPGKTRKSAASAKPATKAAASVHIVDSKAPKKKGMFGGSSTGSKTQKQREKERERDLRRKYYDPGTPEYKKWRRWWWISIAIALIFTTFSFAAQMLPGMDATITYVMLGIGYAFLIFAIYIDTAKVRKIRRQYAQMMGNSRSKAATRQRKAAIAQTKKEEAEAREAGIQAAKEKEAKKEARAARFGFGKKKAEAAKAEDGAAAASKDADSAAEEK